MRSKCPLNYGIELFGDKWSFLIIRDLMFSGKRYYGEFLNSEEKISTNILAARLVSLENDGIITKSSDPNHKQKVIYSLTKKGIDLMPVLTELGLWARNHGDKNVETEDAVLDRLDSDKEKALSEMKSEVEKQHLKGKDKGKKIFSGKF